MEGCDDGDGGGKRTTPKFTMQQWRWNTVETFVHHLSIYRLMSSSHIPAAISIRMFVMGTTINTIENSIG